MNADRSRAYSHVLKLVGDLSASKLHQHEQDVVREAADALLFTAGTSPDAEARAALDRLEELVSGLVEAERLLPETGEALLDAVDACGPHRTAA